MQRKLSKMNFHVKIHGDNIVYGERVVATLSSNKKRTVDRDLFEDLLLNLQDIYDAGYTDGRCEGIEIGKGLC